MVVVAEVFESVNNIAGKLHLQSKYLTYQH